MASQFQAIDATTGDAVWISECGVNMGASRFGRGAGRSSWAAGEGGRRIHDFGEDGQDALDPSIAGIHVHQTCPVANDEVRVFRKGDHLRVDAKTVGVVLDKRCPFLKAQFMFALMQERLLRLICLVAVIVGVCTSLIDWGDSDGVHGRGWPIPTVVSGLSEDDSSRFGGMAELGFFAMGLNVLLALLLGMLMWAILKIVSRLTGRE